MTPGAYISATGHAVFPLTGVNVPGAQGPAGPRPNALRALKGACPPANQSDPAAAGLVPLLIAERRAPAPTHRVIRVDLPPVPAVRPRASARFAGLALSASAVVHLALMAWLLVGPGLDMQPLDIEVTKVTAVSEADYVRAVAAGLVPVAAAPVAVTEHARAVGATRRLGHGSEDLRVGVPEPMAARPVAPEATASQPAVPVRPERSAPLPARPTVVSAVTSATPVTPAETVTATEVVEARPEEPRPTEVARAPRPPERPRDLTSEPEPEPRVADAEPSQGNADVAARRGTPDGQADGTARRAAEAEAQASAAAASYPSQVMQRLSRTRRDRIRVAGTAVISFTVAEDGGLAALGVAQGSGVPEVDQAGLALVQRAAPFPAPPDGAQRSFSFQFTGD